MNIWLIVLPLLGVSIAFANARYYHKQGYKFWLTFLFSLLLVGGIGAMFLKAFNVI